MGKKAQPLQTLKNLNKNSQEQARARIKVGMLISRLQGHVENDDPEDKKAVLSATQISAAQLLLSKVMPNLTQSSTDHTEHVEHSISPQTLAVLNAFKALQQQPTEKLIPPCIDIPQYTDIPECIASIPQPISTILNIDGNNSPSEPLDDKEENSIRVLPLSPEHTANPDNDIGFPDTE